MNNHLEKEDNTSLQISLWKNYCEQLNANRLENLSEMDDYLGKIILQDGL